MRTVLTGIQYSFPVQLLILHIKRNHFLILFWLFLILLITNTLAGRYGVSLLFLDPEYMGRVGFSGFFIMGFSFGAFLMVWNVTSYILFARNFSFLATLNRPFEVYCINNMILPLLFFLIYGFEIISFQAREGLLDAGNVFVRLGGFICGIVIFMLPAMIYFFRTNKNIFQIITFSNKKTNAKLDPLEPTHEEVGRKDRIRVEYYVNHTFRIKLTRSADHYPESVIRSVYRQHHINVLFIELTGLLLIVLFGFLIDYPVFRIPAGSSILLLCAILMLLIGVFSYWLGSWKLFLFIMVVVLIDALMRWNVIRTGNKAYGITYQSPPAAYNIDALQQMCDSSIVERDRENTLHILNNWKNKFATTGKKPKIIFINCSGGGLRSTAFVMQALQKADSITNHELMQNCVLMTGASGGMLAAAYYRELYLDALNGENINPYDTRYYENISSDMLNAICFTLVVNDLFIPLQRFETNGNSYSKDRGYMFERIFDENTDSALCKTIGAYAKDEEEMRIPMMLLSPTIINDERKLFIGAQSFSYLAVSQENKNSVITPEIDGVDIHQIMSGHDPDSLLMTSALRMNCTFPYILPTVYLPTDPQIHLMDAGVRDNYGIESTAKFIDVFKDWIMQNTDGVIMVNIRGIEQVMKIKNRSHEGLFDKMVTPIGSLYTNWAEIQDYQQDNMMNQINDILQGKLQIITFEYTPDENSRRASLSFHLTAKEKEDIAKAVGSTRNTLAYRKLQEALGE